MLVTIPAATAAFWVWQIYARLTYGFWTMRLTLALCSLLPTIVMNDKKIATFLKVAPGAVDVTAIAAVGLIVCAVVASSFGRLFRR